MIEEFIGQFGAVVGSRIEGNSGRKYEFTFRYPFEFTPHCRLKLHILSRIPLVQSALGSNVFVERKTQILSLLHLILKVAAHHRHLVER